MAQISVKVANIQARPSKAEAEQGSTRTTIDCGLAAPEGKAKANDEQGADANGSATYRKGIGHRFPSLDAEICRVVLSQPCNWRCFAARQRAGAARLGQAATHTPSETTNRDPGKSYLFLLRSPDVR